MDTIRDAAWYCEFRKKLLKWYRRDHRKLPWRETHDPYAIWISEIMLQQTQVATVVEYYLRFLKRFPDVQALASASEQQVLALWSGLGYYRRARQLHAAAKVIQREHGGEFPVAVEDVRALPGVGRYTAGAITSLAYDQRNPILEANTVRLFSRLLALRDDPKTVQSQNVLWHFAEELLPRRSGNGIVNQALMELGSVLCTPVNPNCDSCPVADQCPTFELGLQASVPRAKSKQQFTNQNHALVLIRRRGKYLMRLNGIGEWWEGLWDFPRTKLEVPLRGVSSTEVKETSRRSLQELESVLSGKLGLNCKVGRWIRTMRHGVTRYRIRLDCFEAEIETGLRSNQLPGQWKWYAESELETLPMTATAKKLHRWQSQPAAD